MPPRAVAGEEGLLLLSLYILRYLSTCAFSGSLGRHAL